MQHDDIKQYAKQVADKLDETNENAIQQIELLLEHMGKDFVDKHVEETLKIQEGDGLKTEDGSRKRSTGGVFFYLIKSDMPSDIRQMIFLNFGMSSMGKVVSWSERQPLVEGLKEQDTPGQLSEVTVRAQGRPQAVKIDQSTTIALMTHSYSRTPLQRGVPQPPDDPLTYAVYMQTKRWKQLEKWLDKDDTDELIIEGVFYPDTETGTFALLASAVSTLRLEAEKVQTAAEPDTSSEADTTEKAMPKPKKKKPVVEAVAASPAPTPAATTDVPSGIGGYDVPDSMPDDAVEELKKLANAADQFRERIKEMEEKNQPGVKMTKRLLSNTEKKIEKLLQEHSA